MSDECAFLQTLQDHPDDPVARLVFADWLENSRSELEDNDLPINECDWNECLQFCQKLGKKERRNYRLPTEGEWEYACRAGTTSAYHFGDVSKLEEYAWYNVGERNTLHAD